MGTPNKDNWRIQIHNGWQGQPETKLKTTREAFTIKIQQRVKGKVSPVLEIFGDLWVDDDDNGITKLVIQATPIKNGKVQQLITLIEEPRNV